MARPQLVAVVLVLLAGGLVQGSTVNRYRPPLPFESHAAFWENPNARSQEARDDEPNYRLPNNTSPSHYDVTLTTNVHTGNLDFKGVVVITIRVDLEETKSIVLHARQLANYSATLLDTVTSISKRLNPGYASDTEFLTLTPEDNSELVQGRIYTVTIEYDGKLRTDNGGFYLSTYINATGQTV